MLPKRKNNSNVSNTGVTRSEKQEISKLQIVTGTGRKGSSSNKPKSEVWNYFGYLFTQRRTDNMAATSASTTSDNSVVSNNNLVLLDDSRIYCK